MMSSLTILSNVCLWMWSKGPFTLSVVCGAVMIRADTHASVVMELTASNDDRRSHYRRAGLQVRRAQRGAHPPSS